MPGTDGRAGWMATLAEADPARLEAAWCDLGAPLHRWLRPAETGLVMLRGRIGGSGSPFNLGEMTLTRAAVLVEERWTGFGHVAGRARRHAELAALLDALLQDPARQAALLRSVVEPLRLAAAKAAACRAAAVGPTRVDFATLVRGDD